MKIELRKYILKSKFKQGDLSDVEQEELFDLLEQDGELELFLDAETRVTPLSHVKYEDKEFLRSLSEPTIKLEADATIIYPNKQILYRKSLKSNYLSRTLRYVAGVAALIICMIYIYSDDAPTIEKLPSIIDQMAIHNQLNGIDIKQITLEKIKNREFKTIIVEANIQQNINTIVTPSITDIDILAEDMGANIEINIDELTLFAEAENWSSSDDISEMEITIGQDQWTASKKSLHEEEVVDKLNGININ